MIIQGIEIYYAAACLILVCSSVFCAFVRYFHMCRPFDENESYFYPARKLITFIFACFALPVVWLFRMDSADAWIFMRSFLILFLPGAAVLSFRRYFFIELKHRKLLFILSGFLPLSFILILWLFAWMDCDILHRHQKTVLWLTGIYSLFITGELFHTTWWLVRQIRHHLQEEFSNEDDFPVHFAGFVVFIPLFYLIAAWGLFVSGDRTYNMVLQLCISAMHIVFLVKILHPQRKEYQEVVKETKTITTQKVELATDEDTESNSLLSVVAKDELEAKIRAVLIEQKLYLNPNLRIGELADAVKSNKKYVSIVMNERFVSFYTELNRLRIEAAMEYKKNHPLASREEIAIHCGFSNVKTYSRNLKSWERN